MNLYSQTTLISNNNSLASYIEAREYNYRDVNAMSILIPKAKPGRKPKPELEALASKLRKLPAGQAEVVPIPATYSSVASFRGNLFNVMKARGLRIRTVVIDKKNELAVYLADTK